MAECVSLFSTEGRNTLENQTLLLLNVGYTANNWGIYQSLTFVLISIQTNIPDGGWKSWCLFF